MSLARPEEFESPCARLEGGCLIQLDDGRNDLVGQIGVEPTKAEVLRLVAAPICISQQSMWCEARESNSEAPAFEDGRYASSRQLRILVPSPRFELGTSGS